MTESFSPGQAGRGNGAAFRPSGYPGHFQGVTGTVRGITFPAVEGKADDPPLNLPVGGPTPAQPAGAAASSPTRGPSAPGPRENLPRRGKRAPGGSGFRENRPRGSWPTPPTAAAHAGHLRALLRAGLRGAASAVKRGERCAAAERWPRATPRLGPGPRPPALDPAGPEPDGDQGSGLRA